MSRFRDIFPHLHFQPSMTVIWEQADRAVNTQSFTRPRHREGERGWQPGSYRVLFNGSFVRRQVLVHVYLPNRSKHGRNDNVAFKASPTSARSPHVKARCKHGTSKQGARLLQGHLAAVRSDHGVHVFHARQRSRAACARKQISMEPFLCSRKIKRKTKGQGPRCRPRVVCGPRAAPRRASDTKLPCKPVAWWTSSGSMSWRMPCLVSAPTW